MSTEVKRAAELTVCDLLKEALSSMAFYPSKGGGNEATPVWQASHAYVVGDILRPTNLTLTKALVVITAGTSDPTEPAFTDVVDTIYTGTSPVRYQTIGEPAVTTEEDASAPEPPFGIVAITEAEMQNDDTWLLHGHVLWVTSMDRENVVTASQETQRIFDALALIDYGYDEYRHLMVHGLDVGSTDEFTDQERQAHADTIEFSMGVSQR